MRNPTPAGDDRPDAFTHLERALDRADEIDDDCLPPSAGADRRRDWGSAVIFTVSVAVLAAVFAYASAVFAVDRAATHTDQRVAVLESDLQQRRTAAAAQNASRDEQIAELRRLVCLFADHSQPRDAAVEAVRHQYQCVPTPTPVPTPT